VSNEDEAEAVIDLNKRSLGERINFQQFHLLPEAWAECFAGEWSASWCGNGSNSSVVTPAPVSQSDRLRQCPVQLCIGSLPLFRKI
jgi:hypothetical protein